MTQAAPRSAPRRVLIVKPSALGDVVTALPVLRGLKRTFPAVRTAWLVRPSCADLIRHDTDLDEVICFDRRGLGPFWRSPAAARKLLRLVRQLRRGGFDWVLELQGLLRSALLARATKAPVRAGFADAREGARWFYKPAVPVDRDMHTVDRNIRLARDLGVDARHTDLRLQVAAAGRSFAEEAIRSHGLTPGGFIVCAPPTRWPTKRWPARHWRAMVRQLVNDLPVVVVGAAGDIDLCRRITEGLDGGAVNLAGQTGVAELVGLIAASAGVVCCDSAAKFIAQATGVDVVVLIGPTRAERTGPYPGADVPGRTVVTPAACGGCLKRRCRHVSCMELISPAEVVGEARRMLEGR